MADVDVAIIGGGLNGACIARDAAGRGLRVGGAGERDVALAGQQARPWHRPT